MESFDWLSPLHVVIDLIVSCYVALADLIGLL